MNWWRWVFWGLITLWVALLGLSNFLKDDRLLVVAPFLVLAAVVILLVGDLVKKSRKQ